MKRKILITVIPIVLFVFTSEMFSNDFSERGKLLNKDSLSKEVEYQTVQFKVGFNLGFEFPYAIGIEGSFLFDEMVDINMGLGFGFNGFKLGFGSRVFPVRDKMVSPMIGAYFYHASGLHSINVTVKEEKGEFRIPSGNALLINAGMRFRFSRGNYLIAGIGYSIAFNGDKAQYISGSKAGSVQSFADKSAVGGYSINVGILLKLTNGNYRIIK
jgi:hypothetical protein